MAAQKTPIPLPHIAPRGDLTTVRRLGAPRGSGLSTADPTALTPSDNGTERKVPPNTATCRQIIARAYWSDEFETWDAVIK